MSAASEGARSTVRPARTPKLSGLMSATLARATAIFCSRKKAQKITEYRDTAPWNDYTLLRLPLPVSVTTHIPVQIYFLLLKFRFYFLMHVSSVYIFQCLFFCHLCASSISPSRSRSDTSFLSSRSCVFKPHLPILRFLAFLFCLGALRLEFGESLYGLDKSLEGFGECSSKTFSDSRLSNMDWNRHFANTAKLFYTILRFSRS